MTKKTYVAPGFQARSLVFDESMLASSADALGSGNDLTRLGNYDGQNFDDLFE